MLAHDAPTTFVDHWGEMSLPEYLDCNRSGKGWNENVIAWHITTSDKVESILSNGLRGTGCNDWVNHERPQAVYLFCARSVVAANIPHILGDKSSDAIVVRVTIPAARTDKLYIDNLYNMSIDDAEMSAIQYRGDIPAEWITL